jgi:hypothetical protein
VGFRGGIERAGGALPTGSRRVRVREPDQALGPGVRRVTPPDFAVDAFGVVGFAVDGFRVVAARRAVEPAGVVFVAAVVVRRRPVAVGAGVAAAAAAAVDGLAAVEGVAVEAAAFALAGRPRVDPVARVPVVVRPRVVLPRGRPGPRRGFATADSSDRKNSSAVRVFVCCAPPRLTPYFAS